VTDLAEGVERADLFNGESEDGSEAGRTVLGRISTIMDAFDHGDQVLTLIDLSQRANLPKSTVHRLAEQLRTIGWLERDYNGYRIGMRLFELGCLALQRNELRDAAFPHLYALAAKTGLAVQLGVLDRGEVIYLERVLVGGYRLPTRLGGRMPAYCTALGKAMLAFDDAAADAVLEHELPRRTPFTITQPDQLRANLAEVRQSGVAYDFKESFDLFGCVAAPIRNSGRAIGAVSVTGPVARMEWDAVAEAVQQTAAAIWAARFGAVKPAGRDGSDGPSRYASNLARTLPRPTIEAS
jgi:DNA-binding IclR family transcriptional regulator